MARQPVAMPCNRKYLRAPLDGRRHLARVRWIVVHDTEGGTAESIARFFEHNPGGYTHLVVDDQECYRSLRNNAIPRGAHGANTAGFHIEQCGFARWSLPVWRRHWRTIDRAAYKTALHCRVFRIVPRWIGASELSRNMAGITSHAECSKAFGGTHTDPGRFWPRRWFMWRVKHHYNQMRGGGR